VVVIAGDGKVPHPVVVLRATGCDALAGKRTGGTGDEILGP
jgi:hypothetical protein